VVVVKDPAKRPLGALGTRDIKLLRGEPHFPLRLASLDARHRDRLTDRTIRLKQADANGFG